MSAAHIPKAVYEQTLLGFLAPIRPFFDDPGVSEIMINGPRSIYIERAGRIELTAAEFSSDEALLSVLRNLSQFIGKPIDPAHPILEGRLPDGSRVEAILPPISPDGAMISIRRFSRDTLTLERLVQLGSLTAGAAEALEAFTKSHINIMVSGGTGSGKTSLLNALTGAVDAGERVVVIEDSREIQPQQRHVIQLESRPADLNGRGAVTIRDIFRASLRMRPDRIIVGEIRGGEALDIVQAMLSGHGGCMGTLHANQPLDALMRLETMAMMSDVELPLPALRMQVGSAVDVVVQVARLADGSRGLTHVSEVRGFDVSTQRYAVVDLFERRYSGRSADGSVHSELVPTGHLPSFAAQLTAYGRALPEVMDRAARSRRSSGENRRAE